LFGRSPGEKTTGTFHRKAPSNGLILAAQNAKIPLCDNQKIAGMEKMTCCTNEATETKASNHNGLWLMS
jgi:hypothetical protein